MDRTLPDLLRHGLDIVFVGINPSIYSVERGHYFARRANRFWPALSRSALSAAARGALGVEALGPEHDAALLDHGFGFTDVVKRATANAAALGQAEFAAAAPLLVARLSEYRPRIACFHGVTGYRPFRRTVFCADVRDVMLGAQAETIGTTRLFVVPNPSPANAHASPAAQTAWYDRLAAFLAAIGRES
jgi:double-stranded uracil-DNA glycosylase